MFDRILKTLTAVLPVALRARPDPLTAYILSRTMQTAVTFAGVAPDVDHAAFVAGPTRYTLPPNCVERILRQRSFADAPVEAEIPPLTQSDKVRFAKFRIVSLIPLELPKLVAAGATGPHADTIIRSQELNFAAQTLARACSVLIHQEDGKLYNFTDGTFSDRHLARSMQEAKALVALYEARLVGFGLTLRGVLKP